MEGNNNLHTYIVELKQLRANAVITVFAKFLRDVPDTGLAYSEFIVLGKVVREITEGESIDLLGGSVFSGVSKEVLWNMMNTISDAGRESLSIPEIITEVHFPAVQIIPIAIYV